MKAACHLWACWVIPGLSHFTVRLLDVLPSSTRPVGGSGTVRTTTCSMSESVLRVSNTQTHWMVTMNSVAEGSWSRRKEGREVLDRCFTATSRLTLRGRRDKSG